MITEILQHRINYSFREAPERELDECDIEHLEKMITEGYSSGELCQYDQETDTEYRGWWEIEKEPCNCPTCNCLNKGK